MKLILKTHIIPGRPGFNIKPFFSCIAFTDNKAFGTTDIFVQLNKRFVVLARGIVDRIFLKQQLLLDSRNIVQ